MRSCSSFLLGGSLPLSLLWFALPSQLPQAEHLLLEVLMFVSGRSKGSPDCQLKRRLASLRGRRQADRQAESERETG